MAAISSLRRRGWRATLRNSEMPNLRRAGKLGPATYRTRSAPPPMRSAIVSGEPVPRRERRHQGAGEGLGTRQLAGAADAACCLYPGLGLALVGAPEESAASEFAADGWRAVSGSGAVINLCGRLSPRESAAALQTGTGAFLGHDSGPMHLAACGWNVRRRRVRRAQQAVRVVSVRIATSRGVPPRGLLGMRA